MFGIELVQSDTATKSASHLLNYQMEKRVPFVFSFLKVDFSSTLALLPTAPLSEGELHVYVCVGVTSLVSGSLAEGKEEEIGPVG